MKRIKCALALLLAVILLVSMSGCALLPALFGGSGFKADVYVKGLIDTNYLNQRDDAYVKMLSEDITEEEFVEQYYSGVRAEAEFFMNYCSIVDVSEETVQRIVDMYDEIYSHTKFEVGEATEASNGYLVSVTIYPIDVMERAINQDGDQITAEFQRRMENGDYNNMTDAEFEEAWADLVISFVEGYVDDLDYLEPQTISVQIIKDDDGIYTIEDSDWQRVDALIIQY